MANFNIDTTLSDQQAEICIAVIKVADILKNFTRRERNSINEAVQAVFDAAPTPTDSKPVKRRPVIEDDFE